jgi:hypothetical protein
MSYTKDPAYNPMVMRQIMDQAMWIVRARREWFNREARQAPMHKFIIKAIEMFRPDDWQKLLLQFEEFIGIFHGHLFFYLIAYA